MLPTYLTRVEYVRRSAATSPAHDARILGIFTNLTLCLDSFTFRVVILHILTYMHVTTIESIDVAIRQSIDVFF